jgi:GNAT superfamily N-acetyltransferase
MGRGSRRNATSRKRARPDDSIAEASTPHEALFAGGQQLCRVTRSAVAREADDWAVAVEQSVQTASSPPAIRPKRRKPSRSKVESTPAVAASQASEDDVKRRSSRIRKTNQTQHETSPDSTCEQEGVQPSTTPVARRTRRSAAVNDVNVDDECDVGGETIDEQVSETCVKEPAASNDDQHKRTGVVEPSAIPASNDEDDGDDNEKQDDSSEKHDMEEMDTDTNATTDKQESAETSTTPPQSSSESDPASEEKEETSSTLPMRAKHVILGRYELDALYGAPLPRRLCGSQRAHFCEFCIKLLPDQTALVRHARKCPQRRPPGREIYRDGDLSVFEVDGRAHRTYCQNLCLLSKLFMSSKSLSYDVPIFAFYVVTKRKNATQSKTKSGHVDENDHHELVAYFSKEKQSAIGNTLSCILTLPQFQRQGYGRFLISLAYELSKRQRIPGTPERPLSDSGERNFRTFWIWSAARLLLEQEHGPRKVALEAFPVSEMSQATGIHANDLLSVLKDMRVCKYARGVYSVTPTEAVRATLQQALNNVQAPRLLCKPEKLDWTPSS